MHPKNSPNALLFAVRCVEDIRPSSEGSRIHTKISKLSHIRITGHFKGKGREGRIVFRLPYFLFVCLRIGSFHRRDIERARKVEENCIEKRLNCLVAERRTAKYRNKTSSNRCGTEGFAKFCGGRILPLFKIARHKRIVLPHHFFNEVFSMCAHTFSFALGYIVEKHLFSLISLKSEKLLFYKIDDALKICLLTHRDLDGNRIGSKTLFNRSNTPLETRTHAIEFVNKTDARNVILICLMPHGL